MFLGILALGGITVSEWSRLILWPEKVTNDVRRLITPSPFKSSSLIIWRATRSICYHTQCLRYICSAMWLIVLLSTSNTISLTSWDSFRTLFGLFSVWLIVNWSYTENFYFKIKTFFNFKNSLITSYISLPLLVFDTIIFSKKKKNLEQQWKTIIS